MVSQMQDFLAVNRQRHNFEFRNPLERKKLWDFAESTLKCKTSSTDHQLIALDCICVLSRDRCDLEDCVSEDLIKQLLQVSQLKSSKCVGDTGISLVSLKCLSNLAYQLEKVRKVLIELDICQSVVHHLQARTEEVHKILPEEIPALEDERMMLRLFFIIAAHDSSCVKDSEASHIFSVVVDFLCLLRYPQHVDVLCDGLKTICNLFSDTAAEEESRSAYTRQLLRHLNQEFLLKVIDQNRSENDGVSEDQKSGILSQCVNTIAAAFKDGNEAEEITTPVALFLVKTLDEKLVQIESGDPYLTQRELCPLLLALRNIAKSSKSTRKALRLEVLPPLAKPEERPEVGNTIRNRLVCLLTSPIFEVSVATGEFLFALCKGKVGRLVKYAGYGNAAGFLVTRGLLVPPTKESESSSSEDSETEEWREVSAHVDPVTGALQQSAYENPLQNMTDEQKEEEAVKLANLLTKLDKAGIVKPARVGPDGKPVPVEHVLELLESVPSQHESDSD